MKKLFSLVLVSVIVFGLTGVAGARLEDSEDFDITARIAAPISVDTVDIDFDTIYDLSAAEETVEFTVEGEANAGYTFSFDQSEVELTHADTEDSLTVDLSTESDFELDESGADAVTVTADILDPGTDVEAGQYSGNATATVEYDY